MHSLKALVVTLLALAQGSAAVVAKTKTKTLTKSRTTLVHVTTTSTLVVASSTSYTKTVTVTVPTSPSFIIASDSAQQTSDSKLARRMNEIHNAEEAAPLDARAGTTKTVTKTVTDIVTSTATTTKTKTVTSGVVRAKTTTSVYAACATDSGNIIGGNLIFPPGGYFISEVDGGDPQAQQPSDPGVIIQASATDCCNACFNTPGCLYGTYVAVHSTCSFDFDPKIQCNQRTTAQANVIVSNNASQNQGVQAFNGPCGTNVLQD